MWQYSVLMDYLDVTDLLILNNDLDRNRHGHRIAFGLSKIKYVKQLFAYPNLKQRCLNCCIPNGFRLSPLLQLSGCVLLLNGTLNDLPCNAVLLLQSELRADK